MTSPARETESLLDLLHHPHGAGGLESVDAPPASRARVVQESAAMAAHLRRCGVSGTDRIVVVCPNDPIMVTTFLATTSCGVCAPLNPRYGPADIDFYLDDLRPRVVLVDETLDTPARDSARLRGIQVIELGRAQGEPSGSVLLDGGRPTGTPVPSPSRSDLALILHTSGTTSRPKMVPLTHGNLIQSARNIADTLGLGPEDRALTIMPLFHIHGLVAGVLAPLSAGGTVVIPPGFLAPEFPGWLDRFRPTWYTAVPTMHQAILERLATEEGMALRTRAPLRFIRSSSAALAPRTIRDLESTIGVPVIEAYGMTEASHQMTSNPPRHAPASRARSGRQRARRWRSWTRRAGSFPVAKSAKW
jgi:acyl-CoA synthetase (AMP-forming)/AMP-acid ligase II